MSTMIIDRTYRIARENTQTMVIDVQERLTPHIHDHENIVKKIIIFEHFGDTTFLITFFCWTKFNNN